MKEETKYHGGESGYSEAVDFLKGFLVLSMILAHCISCFFYWCYVNGNASISSI